MAEAAQVAIDPSTRLALYRSMVRARYFEQRAYDLFMEGIVKGTTHLGLGQEAVAAGFAEAMQPDRHDVLHLPRATTTPAAGSPDGGL